MLETIKKIMEEKLGLEGVDITESTSFKEDLEIDSLDLFDLVMEFEDSFGVEIPSQDLENITTVGGLIEYIKSKQEK